MITKMIRLRPHHGLCIQHFTGKGYSAAFVANMTHVIAVLRAMPETQIELTADMDVLCACCPHNQEELVNLRRSLPFTIKRFCNAVGCKWDKGFPGKSSEACFAEDS